MLKDDLKIMLGGNIIDVPLADQDYDLVIRIAEESYPVASEPSKHRRLALAECLTILGLAMSKFSEIAAPNRNVRLGGEIYLDQANYIRKTLTED